MKIISMIILILLLGGCSSGYTPSEKMLEYKKSMTVEQAIQVIQKSIWDVSGLKGICGSRGFWYDDKSNMLVYEDKISMLAHKRGRELEKHHQGFDAIVVFEKQYYEYDFMFNVIDSIVIYDDPYLLPVFPLCNKDVLDEGYLIIDLFGDKLNNFKFIVLAKDFDETMAALSIILPDKPVKLK